MSKAQPKAQTLATSEDVDPRRARAARASPGIVVVFCAGAPASVAMAIPAGGLELGRDRLEEVGLADDKMSRRHARIERARGGLHVRDLGSRNGTFVGGARCPEDGAPVEPGDVIRLGHTLLLVVDDVDAFRERPTRDADGIVSGATFAKLLDQVAALAPRTRSILILGESGAGKEVCAQAFHRNGPHPDGPFVAVNCATIPASLAERLLFGTRPGAYSGADAAAPGYLQAADGGTLFLDEIGELDVAVQGKLLRVLETGEVTALGATRPTRIDVRFCAATLRDLTGEIAEGRFRHDLYYRIARGQVRLAPLRERREEIPWHVERRLRGLEFSGTIHATFVEACMLRHWPGNVRELLAATERAGLACIAQGHDVITADELDPTAGVQTAPAAPARAALVLPDDEAVERALKLADGNVSAAARALGVHRTQLRRWIERRRDS